MVLDVSAIDTVTTHQSSSGLNRSGKLGWEKPVLMAPMVMVNGAVYGHDYPEGSATSAGIASPWRGRARVCLPRVTINKK